MKLSFIASFKPSYMLAWGRHVRNGPAVSYGVSPVERLLTIRETAARCGLSVRQIHKLISSGRFGPEILRISRSVRVRESGLEAWFASGCPDREAFEAARQEMQNGKH